MKEERMNLSMDAIRARTSVRTYDGESISPSERNALQASFAEAVPGPFGATPRFIIASRDEIEDEASRGPAADGAPVKGGIRIGTYGMIIGPRNFIAGVVARRPYACVDFGYCLEGIVLRATELGLGTCWIGGAFGRGAIARALGASKDEFVPATTPVGRAAPRPSIQERIVRGSAKARTRKDGSELFFEATKSGALEPLRGAGAWTEILEAVRMGPSASNKQPWRLVLDKRAGEALHLVMHEDQRYNNMLGEVKLQELDMGIAMRHVEVAASALGIKGAWSRLDVDPISLEEPDRYIATFA
jgi:nitroreductase